MTRVLSTAFILPAALVATGVLIVSPGCSDVGVGDPCTPEQEFSPSFLGFNEKEVNVESKSFQCRTRICLVNHFRGRASCPYGQSSDGNPPPGSAPGATGCVIPGTTQKVTGLENPGNPESFVDPRRKATVEPNCRDRPRDKAVYCSCRCADINGETPSDQTFCECPSGFACRPLVTSIGQGNEGLTGSYCIKDGTEYDQNTSCQQGNCDPIANKCAE